MTQRIQKWMRGKTDGGARGRGDRKGKGGERWERTKGGSARSLKEGGETNGGDGGDMVASNGRKS